MGTPPFRSQSEVIPALPDGADEALTHAPPAVSITPVLVGLIVMGLGLFFTSASYHNPFVLPAEAPGAEVTGGVESSVVPFPEGLDGTIDVYVLGANSVSDELLIEEREQQLGIVERPEQPASSPTFAVTDSRGEPVDSVAYTRLSRFEGPGDGLYEQMTAVDVQAGDEFQLSVRQDWTGRVAFVSDDDPPTDPNWRPIIQGIVVAFIGASLALVGGVRRVLWRARMKRYRAELVAAGRST